MPSVVFSHTKKQEKEYLCQLLEERAWFQRKQFPVFLPQSEDHIKQEVSRKDESLKQKITRLQKVWRKVELRYFQTAKRFHHKRLLLKYKCHISRFGPEGKYCRPNLIFVRLRTKHDEKRVIETIGHELLHLLFADLFASKKLSYAEREGMIDALMLQNDLAHLFPRYKRQSIGQVRPRLLKSILP